MSAVPHSVLRERLDRRHSGNDQALGAIDADAVIVWGNQVLIDLMGIDRTAWYGRNALELVHPKDVDRAAESLAGTTTHGGRHVPDVFRLIGGDDYRLVQLSGDNRLDDPYVPVIEFSLRLADDRARTEALASDQASFLTGLALDEPLSESLGMLADLAERHGSAGSVAISALTSEGHWSVQSAPSLDQRVVDAIDGMSDESLAFTMSEALRRSEPVIDGDIALAPAWRDHLDLAEEVGLRACWSFPILGAGHGSRVLGSVDIYRRVPGDPGIDEWALFGLVSRLAGLAIQRSRLVSELRYQAERDPLTGLLNRRGFTAQLDTLVAESGRSIGVLLVDVDRFKLINDAHGHGVGDQILDYLSANLRDAAESRRGVVGRMGGDEFVVAVPVDSTEELASFGELLRHRLSASRLFSGAMVTIRTSIGSAISNPEEARGERLIRNADVALYAAKRDGRNRCRIFDKTLRADVDRRVELEAGLEEALERGQIEVFYQPLVTLDGLSITGVEALARWRRPGHGLISPDEFIAVAEDTGQIMAIDRLVLTQARVDVARWNGARSPADDPLRLWVNVSAGHFGQDPQVDELVPTENVPLGIELTEHTLSGDPTTTAELLASLRRAGSQIAVDDFGTGYSSLQYLEQYPVTRLKIDRSFISALEDGSRSAIDIVKAVVALGHALGLAITAEGIETVETLATVKELGVDVGQGYFFSRPLSVKDLTAKFGPTLRAPAAWSELAVFSAATERRVRRVNKRPPSFT